jgi:membrane protein DedA with SNARE-associated domain
MIPPVMGFTILNLALVFAWVFLDSWGLPGASLMILATASLAGNIPALSIVILVVFIAACMGDLGAYSFARVLSKPLLTKLRKFSFFRDEEEKARAKLVKYEFPIIYFSRFAMGSLCPIINYIAGIEKISKTKFTIAVITGELTYAIWFSTLGYLFGEIANSILGTINYTIFAVIGVIIIIAIIKYLIKKNSK